MIMYLLSIAAANLSVTAFGPASAPINAFLFIGLDFTVRDHLHDRWQQKHLWPRMANLVIAGSLLSFLLNQNAGPVAVASAVAFAASGAVDAVVYHLARNKTQAYRINVSNLASSAVDSVVFPVLSFGAVLPWVMLLQFGCKVLGGYVWSVILAKKSHTVT